jgi:hypothetical protein
LPELSGRDIINYKRKDKIFPERGPKGPQIANCFRTKGKAIREPKRLPNGGTQVLRCTIRFVFKSLKRVFQVFKELKQFQEVLKVSYEALTKYLVINVLPERLE